ncbi:MAG: helix-turn-helix domain-containing protein, partial [Candidatus Kryptonium sp.]
MTDIGQGTIGQRIKAVREALGLSQKAFGERIGRAYMSIYQYESGKRIPDETTLLLISSEFGVSLEWLKTGKGDMWAKKPQAEEVYPVELVAIPVITSVGAGGYIYTPDHVLIERSRLKAKTVVAFKVDGDSMHPTIQKGEFVLVEEEDKEPVDGY